MEQLMDPTKEIPGDLRCTYCEKDDMIRTEEEHPDHDYYRVECTTCGSLIMEFEVLKH